MTLWPGPTLAELRAKAQKGKHREIGNWLARRVMRPSAIYGTWIAVRLGVSANQVTLLALMTNLLAAIAIGWGTSEGFIAGVLLLHAGFWLDHVDGQVARFRETSSLDGVYFDYMMHHAANLALGFALGHGYARHSGDANWSIAGFLVAFGWLGLSLHNDCRYKAFFQRLKRETGMGRVQGGGGARPSPPMPWPRRGLGAVTWPLYKLCEPHAVVMLLSGIAVVMAISPGLGYRGWSATVGGFALVAPTLAAARSWRAIQRRTAESEFNAWFPDFATTVNKPKVQAEHKFTTRKCDPDSHGNGTPVEY